MYDSPIVATIEPKAPFYRAEDYHQGYYRGHANQPCAAVISPKMAKLRSKYKGWLATEQHRRTRAHAALLGPD
jgi:peptide-methionine (S)-S-oxide reductase